MAIASTTRFRPSRFSGLDALRGVAALSVVLFHFTFRYDIDIGHQGQLGWSFSYGHYGVDLFFMISGFVIVMTLDRVESVSEFAVARMARLYPAFLCALTLTSTVLYLSDLRMFRPSSLQIVANLTMAPQLFGQECVDGSYWTLAVELIFYLMAASYFAFSRSKDVEKWCLVWLVLTMTAWIGAASGALPRGLENLFSLLKELSLAPYAGQFIIGIMFYRIVSQKSTLISYLIIAICIYLATRLQVQNATAPPVPGWLNGLIIFLFAVLLWIGVTDRLPSAIMPVLLFLGEISYSLYLIHQRIGYVVIHSFEARGMNPNIAILMTTPLVILLAWAMRRYVELPAQRGIRTLYSAHRYRRARTEPA